MRKKILFIITFSVFLLLSLHGIFAYTSCPANTEYRHVLRKALIDFLSDPSNSKLSENELKQLLIFYSTNDLSTADCSGVYLILDKANTTIPENVVSKCSDNTEYGECSSIKPIYCCNGQLINKCNRCQCPTDSECKEDGSCATPVTTTSTISSTTSTTTSSTTSSTTTTLTTTVQTTTITSTTTTTSTTTMTTSSSTSTTSTISSTTSTTTTSTTTTISRTGNRLFYVVYHDVLVDSSGKPNNNAYRIANAHPLYVHTYARVSGSVVNIPQEVRDLMHNNGVKILCYVKSAPPDSISPPFPDVQIRSEIADGMILGCDGIMFDNVRKQFSTYFNTYKGWRDYVKNWGSDKIAWFNTGHADMDESIMQVADIVEVEHHIDDLVMDSSWVTKYPATRFAANVISWEDISYYPLGYKVTLETAIRDTNHCWNAGHIAYMYSANIKNSIGWLPTWFEDYVRSI